MKIYLVRHGETPWNEEMRYQGQSDVPLSERGRRQAQALRDAYFADQRPMTADDDRATKRMVVVK
jgi:broad specificity phosphatase PhoE